MYCFFKQIILLFQQIVDKHVAFMLNFLFLKNILKRRPEYTNDDYLEASYHVNKNEAVLPCKSFVRSVVLDRRPKTILRKAFKKCLQSGIGTGERNVNYLRTPFFQWYKKVIFWLVCCIRPQTIITIYSQVYRKARQYLSFVIKS